MPQTKAKRTSRKSKKGKKKYQPVRAPYQPVAKPMVKTTSGEASIFSRPQEIVPQFPYLGRELKRIGILAGAMIIILIIVSIVL
jgi:hypothetical protein